MDHIELIIFGLLLAISGLVVLARLSRIPYPILLVLGGLGFGFIPGIPDVTLDPDLVLLIFLPPLLYAAAFFSNLRELRRNAKAIGMLAIGLVIVTTLVVALVGHYLLDLDWRVAFVLGAVVSPTDAVAPAEILRRLGVPRRVISVVLGENLTNDWTALVFYKFAVGAVVTGSFELASAGPKFLLTGIGGVAVGVAIGAVVAAVRRRVEDPLTETTISLLTAYAAYLPAEELGVSGVLAAVSAGVWLGWRASELTTHTTRLQLNSVWELLQFLLNAVLFVLIGLQLPVALEGLGSRSTGTLIAYAVLVSVTVIVVRLVWVIGTGSLFRLRQALRGHDAGGLPESGWKGLVVVSWSSMRGAVSLAAALAIPITTDSGAPFPERDLIIFLTFSVIIATLVLQGLAFPPLIAALDVEDDGLDQDEELAARLETAFAAVERIETLDGADWVHPDTIDRVRRQYEYRQRRFSSRVGDIAPGNGDAPVVETDDFDYETRAATYRRFMGEVIGAQRDKLRELRDGGTITDEVRRRVEYDLDLEEARLAE